MSKNYTHSPGCILKVFEADLLSLVKCTLSACLYFNRKCEQKKKSYKPLHYVVNTCVSIQLLESDRLDIDSRSWNASHLT